MKLPFARAHGRHEARSKRRQVVLVGLGAATLTVVATVAAWPASAAPTTGEIRGDAATAVADSDIVVLKDSVSASGVGSTTDSLASKYGGKVGQRYSRALRGFEVSLREAKARQLAGNPAVS
jgi:hypothetical protein